jgi:hypothetical protein
MNTRNLSSTPSNVRKIVVLGGTGLIGKPLVARLRTLGHTVVVASPSQGVNAVTGEGLAADHVGRFLLGVWPKFVGALEQRRIDINSAPGLLMILKGKVPYAFSFEIAADRVRAIHLSCNPEKLRHLHAAPPS